MLKVEQGRVRPGYLSAASQRDDISLQPITSAGMLTNHTYPQGSNGMTCPLRAAKFRAEEASWMCMNGFPRAIGGGMLFGVLRALLEWTRSPLGVKRMAWKLLDKSNHHGPCSPLLTTSIAA